MISIRKGNNVNQQNAEKLAAALEMPLSELFTPVGEGHKTLSGKTIQHYHRLISVILNTAVEWGVLFSNPCERTKTPKAEEKEAKYIDEVQADALISAIETADELHRTIVRLLLFTGMRRGEALGLKSDCRRLRLMICARTKSRRWSSAYRSAPTGREQRIMCSRIRRASRSSPTACRAGFPSL